MFFPFEFSCWKRKSITIYFLWKKMFLSHCLVWTLENMNYDNQRFMYSITISSFFPPRVLKMDLLNFMIRTKTWQKKKNNILDIIVLFRLHWESRTKSLCCLPSLFIYSALNIYLSDCFVWHRCVKVRLVGPLVNSKIVLFLFLFPAKIKTYKES